MKIEELSYKQSNQIKKEKKSEQTNETRNAETTIGVFKVWTISILVQKWND